MKQNEIISANLIESKILLIRGMKVMLDKDLAFLYGVSTGRLNEQVKRNIHRFPSDFMFQLSIEEFTTLISQNAISRRIKGGTRKLPFAFTEQGVAMLSSVLRSQRAVKVNIQIMRAFVKLREIIANHKELALKLRELELKIESHDESIRTIFDAINQLLVQEEKPKRRIGFEVKEKSYKYKASKKAREF
jgi:hypothetical protein